MDLKNIFKRNRPNQLLTSDLAKQPAPLAEATTNITTTKKKNAVILIGGTVIAVSTALLLFPSLYSNTKETLPKPENKIIEKKNPDVIYNTTLANTIDSPSREFEATYPLGNFKVTNTIYYAFNIINNLDVITIDPLGEPFPFDSKILANLPNLKLGKLSLIINLDSLPKQNYFIRVITKNGSTLTTVNHYYMSNNPFDRNIKLLDLKSGAYYIQALNLVTHVSYISTPFYLDNSGSILGGKNINFERIDSKDIFSLPEKKEIDPLSVDEIPIVLNDRFETNTAIKAEDSPFEKTPY